MADLSKITLPNNNTYDFRDDRLDGTYGSCLSGASASSKVASCRNYSLSANSYVHISMENSNASRSALTLNIEDTGAKPIYINGSVSSATNYTLPSGSYLVYYDGTNYYFRTDGKITGNITGDAFTVNGHSVGTNVPTNAIFTDTTYESKAAAIDGTELSLVTTGEKYIWSQQSSLTLGETSTTAYRGDRGKTAYDHASDSDKLTTAQSSGLYKIATTTQGHVASAIPVEKSDITGLGIPAQDTTYESKTASSGGTDVSLVTTGEKYSWNNKIDKDAPVCSIDTSAASGTDDGNLYTAISNLSWTSIISS